MPDIISAKCYGCGHVIRVPASLGGRKAKCPSCNNVIIIPSPADSTDGIVSDDLLPEVAKEAEEIVEGEEILEGEEAEEVVEGEAVDEESSTSQKSSSRRMRAMGRGSTARRGRGTKGPKRGSSSKSGSRMPAQGRRGGRRGEEERGTRMRGPAKKSNTGVIIGVIVGIVLLVGVVIAIVASGGGGDNGAGPGTNGDQPGPDPNDAARAEIRKQFDAFVRAYNNASIDKLLNLYAVKNTDDEKRIRTHYSDRGFNYTDKYEKIGVPTISVNGNTGTLEVTLDEVAIARDSNQRDVKAGVKKTFSWEKVGDSWLLATMP